MYPLYEDSRSQLISKGKFGEREKSDNKTRYEKRVKSKFANNVRNYNKIDMNKLFKDNILTVNIDIHGETDDYIATISFGGFLDLLRDNLKRSNNILDLRTIIISLTQAFNSDNVYLRCSCLHPTTRIKLLDGSNPTVEELKVRFDNSEKLYVYTTDRKGDFEPAEIEDVWVTKEVTDFVKITLDNGETIITTPDHLYRLSDGIYRMAGDLQEGQSLMTLYFRYIHNGYEEVRDNSDGHYRSVYKRVAKLGKEKTKNITEDDHKHMSAQGKKINANPTHDMIEQCKRFNEAGKLRNYDEAVNYFQLNHKVVKVENIKLQPTPVYDIKVKGNNHNFLVSAGVILHNCSDFYYRFGYWTSKTNIIVGDKQNIPSNITNPHNKLGPGCKHLMLVLSNTGWLIKTSSVINNYVHYMEKYREQQYADIIYPAIYGKKYEKDVQTNIFGNEAESDEETLNKSNEEGRVRGRFSPTYQPNRNKKTQNPTDRDDKKIKNK